MPGTRTHGWIPISRKGVRAVIDPLLPEPLGLGSCQVQIAADQIVILARTANPSAACPACGRSAGRVHSRYTRRLADLPRHGRHARLLLEVRRFFCDTAGCRRRIFGERVPAVAGKHARQTGELTQALTGIGFVCGGKAGRGSPADSGCRPARTRCCAVSAKVPPRLPASRGCSAWMTGPCGAANATAPCSAIWNDTSPWICWVSDQPTGLPTGWRFAGWLVERTRCVAVASLAAGDELVFGDDWGLFSAIRPMNLASTASRTRS